MERPRRAKGVQIMRLIDIQVLRYYVPHRIPTPLRFHVNVTVCGNDMGYGVGCQFYSVHGAEAPFRDHLLDR